MTEAKTGSEHESENADEWNDLSENYVNVKDTNDVDDATGGTGGDARTQDIMWVSGDAKGDVHSPFTPEFVTEN